MLDEMWSPMIAAQLRVRGHVVEAVAERDDLRGMPDEVISAVAEHEQRCIITENASDYRIFIANAVIFHDSRPGLILTTNRRYPRHDNRTIGRLVLALDGLMNSGISLTDRELWLP